MRICHSLAALASLTAPLFAQLTGPGLGWQGTSGGNARSFVPSCTTLQVAAVAGETVTVTVYGNQASPYVLALSLSTGPCQTFPGLGAGLVLGTPVVTFAAGVLTQTTPCLVCPPGFEASTLVLPAWLPRGTALSFQAVGFGGRGPSFTTAITGTV